MPWPDISGHGGELVTNAPVDSLADAASRIVMRDVTPRRSFGWRAVDCRYRWRLSRYRYGPGCSRWIGRRARALARRTIARTCTNALGEIAESSARRERSRRRTSVSLVVSGRFDPTRAPDDTHEPSCRTDRQPHSTTWGAPRNRRDARDHRHAMFPADLERSNANLVGGDIAGGAADLAQVYARPIASLHPYTTPIKGVYLCSSSTPPGVGVHGMCGHYAARAALKL